MFQCQKLLRSEISGMHKFSERFDTTEIGADLTILLQITLNEQRALRDLLKQKCLVILLMCRVSQKTYDLKRA